MEDKSIEIVQEKKMTDYDIAKKLVQLKQSANSRNLNFNLSFNTVKRLMLAKTCFYTGVKFDNEYDRSIDRVDPSLGYVEGNVVVCTIQINSKKSNLTPNEILLLAKKIKTHNLKQRR